jgi:FkbM family methyltransferase
VIRSYKNWVRPILDQCGVLSAEYDLTLRNGIVITCRPRVGDWHVVNQMWFSCPYFYNGHAIDAHTVVVDIGAHTGAFSLRAATFAPGVRVYAYEASLMNYRLLEHNIARNGLAGNIAAYQTAVGGTRGKRKFYSDSSSAGNSLITPSSCWNEGADVDCVMLNDVFDDNKIQSCGFLKIDVEGAEYEILSTTRDEYLKRVEMLSLEYHQVPGYDVGMLRERLESLDFEVAIINRPHLLFANNRNFKEV